MEEPEEIPPKKWDKPPINWCRISSTTRVCLGCPTCWVQSTSTRPCSYNSWPLMHQQCTTPAFWVYKLQKMWEPSKQWFMMDVYASTIEKWDFTWNYPWITRIVRMSFQYDWIYIFIYAFIHRANLIWYFGVSKTGVSPHNWRHDLSSWMPSGGISPKTWSFGAETIRNPHIIQISMGQDKLTPNHG